MVQAKIQENATKQVLKELQSRPTKKPSGGSVVSSGMFSGSFNPVQTKTNPSLSAILSELISGRGQLSLHKARRLKLFNFNLLCGAATMHLPDFG